MRPRLNQRYRNTSRHHSGRRFSLGACPPGSPGPAIGAFDALKNDNVSWASASSVDYVPNQSPNARREAKAVLQNVQPLRGSGQAFDRLEVLAIPSVLDGMASESSRGSNFIFTYGTAGQLGPSLATVISIRSDSTAIFIGPCTGDWTDDLTAFARESGPAGTTGHQMGVKNFRWHDWSAPSTGARRGQECEIHVSIVQR